MISASSAQAQSQRRAKAVTRWTPPPPRVWASKGYSAFKWVILIGFAIAFIYPILWLFVNSFKTNTELFTSAWTLPDSLSLENYVRALDTGNIGKSFLNSVIITSAVVVCTTALSSMAAYALTRLRWRFSGVVLAVMLLAIMIPAHAAVIPLFSMFNTMGINGTYLAVILPHVVFTLPIGILVFTGFYRSLPSELEEAAKIDGASTLRAFRSIILPISTPAIVTVAVITFIAAWNDLLFPQIFISDPDLQPLPVGLTQFQGRYSTDYVGLIAAVVITIVPSLAVYLILQRRVVSGITAGATKG